MCVCDSVKFAPSTNLDELMFVHLAFFMQELQQREERLVSRQMCLSLSLSLCCSQLLCTTWLNLNVLVLPGFVSVIIMKPALEHDLFKALPECHHGHPSLVQGVCSRSLLGGTACMCVCVCMNKAYNHGHSWTAMRVCAYVCA